LQLRARLFWNGRCWSCRHHVRHLLVGCHEGRGFGARARAIHFWDDGSMATGERLYTKQELIQLGVETVPASTPSRLRATFEEWQTRGLIGSYERKEARRGGAGLWHPLQKELWLAELRHRDAGHAVIHLANFPVGAWFLFDEGIRIEQVQLAFGTWATAFLEGLRPVASGPALDRSARRYVDQLADPAASEADRRVDEDVADRRG